MVNSDAQHDKSGNRQRGVHRKAENHTVQAKCLRDIGS